jgi:hypothetical protein
LLEDQLQFVNDTLRLGGERPPVAIVDSLAVTAVDVDVRPDYPVDLLLRRFLGGYEECGSPPFASNSVAVPVEVTGISGFAPPHAAIPGLVCLRACPEVWPPGRETALFAVRAFNNRPSAAARLGKWRGCRQEE